MNLTGSVNLLKLEKAGIATIKNKKCVVIPIEEKRPLCKYGREPESKSRLS